VDFFLSCRDRKKISELVTGHFSKIAAFGRDVMPSLSLWEMLLSGIQ